MLRKKSTSNASIALETSSRSLAIMREDLSISTSLNNESWVSTYSFPFWNESFNEKRWSSLLDESTGINQSVTNVYGQKTALRDALPRFINAIRFVARDKQTTGACAAPISAWGPASLPLPAPSYIQACSSIASSISLSALSTLFLSVANTFSLKSLS